MDVKEIIEKKEQLTRDIYRLVKSFHEETDTYINDLNYRLLNVTTAGDPRRDYIAEINIVIKL